MKRKKFKEMNLLNKTTHCLKITVVFIHIINTFMNLINEIKELNQTQNKNI